MNRSNKTVIIAVVSIIVVIGINFGINENGKTEVSTHKKCEPNQNTICLGLIFPRSGDLSTHGNENLKSAEHAVIEFNNEHLGNTELILDYQIEDSATNPIVVLEHMKKLHAKKINIILGLEASENINEIIEYADTNEMLLISCCSSASSLAIPNDSVFRLVPDDSNQGKVLAKLMLKDGIKKVIPIWRDDVWGNGLYKEVKRYFVEGGGNVTVGINYPPNSPESVSMSKLNEMVIEHTEKEMSEVAVLFLSFKEIADFMELAEKSETSELEQVKWYGPGAITKEREISKYPSNLFSQNIDLTTIQVAASKNPTHDRVKAQLTESINTEPNTFVYSSYDSVWIVGLAILETIHETHVNDMKTININTIKGKIPEIAANYTDGAIGVTKLNAAGDLEQANYDVWKLQEGNWITIGHYYTDELDSEWKFNATG